MVVVGPDGPSEIERDEAVATLTIDRPKVLNALNDATSFMDADQFMVTQGTSDAREGAARWVANNLDIYHKTGNLVEKYDVENIGVLAGGGEYEVQTGFGWTNGVLLKFLNELDR